MKIASWGLRLGPSWGALGALLGRLGLAGASRRRPQGVWGHLRPVWGPPWSVLSRLGSLLGLSWAVLRPSWAILGRLGSSWSRLGAILGRISAPRECYDIPFPPRPSPGPPPLECYSPHPERHHSHLALSVTWGQHGNRKSDLALARDWQGSLKSKQEWLEI